jgi:hypothetical protein
MKQIRRRRDGFNTRRQHISSNNAYRRNLRPIYDMYGPTTTHIPYEQPVQHINRMSVTQHGDHKYDQTQIPQRRRGFHNDEPDSTTARCVRHLRRTPAGFNTGEMGWTPVRWVQRQRGGFNDSEVGWTPARWVQRYRGWFDGRR